MLDGVLKQDGVPTAGTLVAEDLVNGDFTAFQCGNRSEEWAHFAVRTSG